jgi:hypothetical protein
MMASAGTNDASLSLRLTIVLLCALIFPDLLLYAGVATSGALGTLLVAIVSTIAFCLPVLNRVKCQKGRRPRSVSGATVILITLTAVALHGLIASIFQPFDGLHAGLSIVLLAGLMGGGFALAEALVLASNAEIDRGARVCLITLVAISIEGILGLSIPSPYASPKPMFPFTEPSHFALTLAPFFLYACVRSRGAIRWSILLLGTLSAVLIQNLTMMIAVMIAAVLCLKRYVVVGLLVVIGLAVTQLDISYYIERVDLTGDTQNLSTVVYLQGWQLVFESINISSGWGLGFQQLGIHGTSVDASDIIFALVGGYGNILDGGFTFAKIVSEFGAFGLVLICIFLVVAFSAARHIRFSAKKPADRNAALFAACIIVCYGIELFVRGAGYFTGTSLLMVAALRVWSVSERREPSGAPQVVQRAI